MDNKMICNNIKDGSILFRKNIINLFYIHLLEFVSILQRHKQGTDFNVKTLKNALKRINLCSQKLPKTT